MLGTLKDKDANLASGHLWCVWCPPPVPRLSSPGAQALALCAPRWPAGARSQATALIRLTQTCPSGCSSEERSALPAGAGQSAPGGAAKAGGAAALPAEQSPPAPSERG